MKIVKAMTIALTATALTATASFAGASNGKGEGKGRAGVAEAVSSEPGLANAASGLNGGWGSVGGVSQGKAATPKE